MAWNKEALTKLTLNGFLQTAYGSGLLGIENFDMESLANRLYVALEDIYFQFEELDRKSELK
jgi:hypothetical protein